MARLHAGEVVQRVTNEALQIHRHYGYTRSFLLESNYRDGRSYGV